MGALVIKIENVMIVANIGVYGMSIFGKTYKLAARIAMDMVWIW